MSININLELTDHCNLKCTMCSQSMRDEAHGVPHRFMNWETWRESLNNLRDFPDEIQLCPHWLGEPTLHPDFDRFISYAFGINHNNQIFRGFRLHTNAVLFSEERSRLLLELAQLPFIKDDTFNFIHFSLDAFSKDTYHIIKGKDTREMAYRNILRFLALRSKLGYLRPFVSMGFVVQPNNAHEAQEFLNFWEQNLSDHSVDFDWQHKECDSIYFRRLNTDNQEKSDLLFMNTLSKLGFEQTKLMRGTESF